MGNNGEDIEIVVDDNCIEENGNTEGSEGFEASQKNHHLTKEQEKRYRFLLGDNELFDRFIEAKRNGTSPLEVLTSHNTHAAAQNDSVRRHRRTERDEDAEMLQEAVAEGKATVVPSFSFTESPSYVTGGDMRSYQVQGLNWLISLYSNSVNGILADEMGLGKTLQTLSLLGYLKNYRETPQNPIGPHLLVVPKSTLQNWLNESRRWIPSLRSFIFHGDKSTRSDLIASHLKNPTSFDVCITSYEMCLSEKAALRKIQWEYIVIDEAHRIKNESSKLAVIVREFRCNRRLLITGTPLQNNLHELWALLNFLLPDIFDSVEHFENWFENHSSVDHEEMSKQLRLLLHPFLLRRLKADVEHTLKPKKEVNLYVGLTDMQRNWYKSILERDIGAVNGLVKNKEGKMRLLNIVMQLRKCCNHPYLFDGAEPGPPFTTDEHLVFNSGKMLVLDKLLARFKANGSRVLLFSQMSRMLDVFEDYCTFRNYQYCRIDGQTAHEDRIGAIEEYNKPDSEKFIFLLTTRAGGLGINLATADIVIIYDSDWNPQVDLQAQDRAHRIGQTKQVCVFRMVTENTIEEKVIEKALQKLRLDQLVIQQGKLTNVNKALSQDEMLSMIRHGAEQIFASGNAGGSKRKDASISAAGADEAADIDIEELLRKGEEKTKELVEKYQNVGYDDLQKFSIETAAVSTISPVGIDDAQIAQNLQNQMLFLGTTGKRERKVNYDVDSYFGETLRIHPPKPKSQKAPIPKNVPILHDFQFFPARLHELVEREIWAYQQSVNYQILIPADEDEEARLERESEQALIDSAVSLNEVEEEEKKHLLKVEGFPQWSRKEYVVFLKAIEHHGKDDYKSIAAEIESKSQAEVKAYSQVFWRNLSSLKDADRIQSMLERTEERLRRNAQIQSTLQRKIARHQKSRTPLRITYFGGKGREYTEEEDIFLIENLAEIGYDQGEEAFEVLRERILQSPLFRFDWLIKTRSPAELQKRCHRLITFIEREHREAAASSTSSKKAKLRPSPKDDTISAAGRDATAAKLNNKKSRRS